MSWKRKTVITLLFLIATLIEEDKEIVNELKKLSNHIQYGERV